MDISYYLFASFIFVLLCIIMLLGKYLYSDIKRQNKLLDEKETKLLRLYQTVEESLEEFFDQVGEAKGEIKMLGSLYKSRDEARRTGESHRVAEDGTLYEPPRFQYIIDEFYDKPPEVPEDSGIHPSRADAILTLWNEGKPLAQIAEALGITKTEVALVLDLNSDGNA